MIDWKIRSRSSECQACHVAFEDGQAYRTLLYAERSEYQRVDVCETCWDNQYGHGASDRKGFVSHWSGKFVVPPPPPPEPVQRESAETALRKLVELNDPSHLAACFILSAMLERKRLLKVRETFEDEGQQGVVYEHIKTGDIFPIRDPGLKLDELADVQRDVADLLEVGVDAFLAERTEGASEDSEASEDGASVSEDTDGTEPTQMVESDEVESVVDDDSAEPDDASESEPSEETVAEVQ